MISISTLEDYTNGTVIIDDLPSSNLKDMPARVARYGTLDGGAVIVNQGFSDGDRTPVVRAEITAAQEAALRDIFESQAYVHISTPDGYFLGAISRMKCDNGTLSMTLLIEEKLSA